MNLSLIQRLGLALALATVATHAAADSIEQLRAENARLRAQLQQLQQSCPVAAAASTPAATVVTPAAPPAAALAAPAAPAAAPAAPATPSGPTVASTVSPAPSAQAAAVAVVPAPAAAQVQPGVVPASPAAVTSVPVPAGYKLVPVNAPDYVDPLSPPYDHAGCSRGVFKGPPPAKWNEVDNWESMRRGLKMNEVNDLLGKEHFDASSRDRVEWQYGKCGDAVGGRVQFVDGQVVYWQAPAL